MITGSLVYYPKFMEAIQHLEEPVQFYTLHNFFGFSIPEENHLFSLLFKEGFTKEEKEKIEEVFAILQHDPVKFGGYKDDATGAFDKKKEMGNLVDLFRLRLGKTWLVEKILEFKQGFMIIYGVTLPSEIELLKKRGFKTVFLSPTDMPPTEKTRWDMGLTFCFGNYDYTITSLQSYDQILSILRKCLPNKLA